MNRSQLLASCLLSPTCVGIGAHILSILESDGTGLTTSTVSKPPTDESDFAMQDVYGMLAFDTILYMLLAW